MSALFLHPGRSRLLTLRASDLLGNNLLIREMRFLCTEIATMSTICHANETLGQILIPEPTPHLPATIHQPARSTIPRKRVRLIPLGGEDGMALLHIRDLGESILSYIAFVT